MSRKPSKQETGTPALRVLADAGVPHTVHHYTPAGDGHDHGQEAVRALVAQGLDVDAERVFKTLLADVDGRLVVAVVPVAAQLDLKALATAVGGKKAAMADPARAQRSSGYVLGGISPLGQRTPLPTVVDTGVTAFPTVLVSAGKRGAQVELAAADLLSLTAGTAAPLAKR